MTAPAAAPPRVVLIAGPGEPTHIVYHALQAAVGVACVIIEEPVGAKQLLKRRLEKLGAATVAGQVLFKAVVEQPLKLMAADRLRAIKRESGLNDGPIPAEAVVAVPSINSAEAIAQLQALKPDVVVVQGTRIIAKRVLQSVGCPFINMHAGITPRYRGVHGGYWALATGDAAHCGVTVHLVDAGIDTGGILAQATIQPTPADSYVTYPLLQLAAGLPLLVQAVRAALAGTLRPVPVVEGPSQLWSHPTLGQWLGGWLRRRVR
ncbi:MAG: formyl transferase [Hymenobacteraceae bacterium]|nr:formyl transferase [Hymenobacteraceae bacterium]